MLEHRCFLAGGGLSLIHICMLVVEKAGGVVDIRAVSTVASSAAFSVFSTDVEPQVAIVIAELSSLTIG